MPIFIVIGCFIGAAILFVIWKLMGSQESFETAFRCAAYMSAISPITAVLGVIPWIGAVLGMLLSLYYVVMASVEVHGIPAKKAWIVFGSIIALLCLVSMCTQYAVKKATRNMEMNNKALQNYLDESSKAMQQKTEMMRQQSQQGQQMPQAQQGPQSQEQMQKQLQETQRQIEEMQRQMQQQKASGK
jgi:glucan phosphoethanolaminetransferase (alkaline phosphatase superfamily)